MTKRRSPGPRRLFWSPEDEQLLRELYPDAPTNQIADRIGRNQRAVYAKAKALGLRKSAEFLSSAASGRLQSVSGVGVATRFKARHEPWNKGKTYVAGGRSQETRFAPGHVPLQWVPIGTETVDSQGYRKRKVRDDAPAGESRRNWRFVHILLWEAENGPVPSGHAIVFRNGDRSDFRIENLELVSRAELARRNSVHNLPEDVKQAIRGIAVLNRQINKLTREPA